MTQQKVQTLINEGFEGRTVITISHRPNTIMQSDKVMVLSFGRIIEYDEPATLAADPDSELANLLKEMEKDEDAQMPFNGL